jgi:hypothetical protein
VSYCRFCPADNRYGWPASDLYVYLDCGGYLLCCGCPLGNSFRAYRTADMVAHVEEHIRAGHVVRASLITDLMADAEENDKWMREYDAEKEGLA